MIRLESNEKKLKIIRRHFLVLAPLVIFIVVAAVAPYVLYVLISSDFFAANPEFLPLINAISDWKTFGYSIWLLLLWIIFFVEWTDYYLDMLVVTNKRLIDIEQKGFFNREITSFFFAQIQDITVETRGVVRTLFHFGDLHIQTAGHSHEIIVKDAAYPEMARNLILNLQASSGPNSSL